MSLLGHYNIGSIVCAIPYIVLFWKLGRPERHTSEKYEVRRFDRGQVGTNLSNAATNVDGSRLGILNKSSTAGLPLPVTRSY